VKKIKIESRKFLVVVVVVDGSPNRILDFLLIFFLFLRVRMKVAILGAGLVGLHIGGYLMKKGHEVVFIGITLEAFGPPQVFPTGFLSFLFL